MLIRGIIAPFTVYRLPFTVYRLPSAWWPLRVRVLDFLLRTAELMIVITNHLI